MSSKSGENSDILKLKARNVYNFSRRSRNRWQSYCKGEITFAEFDATVQGWINHVRYADTWRFRRFLLGRPLKRVLVKKKTVDCSNIYVKFKGPQYL
jgi:hypothetical protein